MKRKENKLNSKKMYQGIVVDIRHDEVLVKNKKHLREVIEHPGGVCVLAFNNSNEVLVVEQFRAGAEDFLIELPAGKKEAGEDPLLTAKRELLEETGYQAKKWLEYGTFYPSPAILNEVIHLYVAQDLKYEKQALEDDEYLDCFFLSLEKLKEMILNHQIKDGKTIALVLKYINRLL